MLVVFAHSLSIWVVTFQKCFGIGDEARFGRPIELCDAEFLLLFESMFYNLQRQQLKSNMISNRQFAIFTGFSVLCLIGFFCVYVCVYFMCLTRRNRSIFSFNPFPVYVECVVMLRAVRIWIHFASENSLGYLFEPANSKLVDWKRHAIFLNVCSMYVYGIYVVSRLDGYFDGW